MVDKITQPITPVEEIEKINEIIDDSEASKVSLNNKLNKQMISNCITEIPQDIKLELNGGTITLKAGSKVYVPNGFEEDGTTRHFDEVVIENDISTQGASNRTTVLFLNPSGNTLDRYNIIYCQSGSTYTTDETYIMWYDTTNNLVKKSSNSGSSWTIGESFPIAVCTETSSGFTAIQQVFNGFGYIGQHVFSLPGVVGLFPNGRNEDGSLKNSKYTQEKVMINSLENQSSRWCRYGYDGRVMGWGVEDIFIQDTPPTQAANRMWYDTASNYLKIGNGSTWATHINILLGRLIKEGSSTQIAAFTPKKAFQALDYNDKGIISSFGVPAGTVIAFAANSAPSGYILCNGAAISRTTYADLYNAIGTTYGTGNGSTTFNLPNLTDKFIQGSGTAGTTKAAGLPNITGGFRGSHETLSGFSGAFYAGPNGRNYQGNTATDSYPNYRYFDASRSNSIYGKSTTVQPPALTMRYYIKY